MTISIWIFCIIVALFGWLNKRFPSVLMSTYMNKQPLQNPKAYILLTSKIFWATAVFIPINYHLCMMRDAILIAKVSAPLTLIWGIVSIGMISQNIQNKSNSYYQHSFGITLVSFMGLSVVLYFMVLH